MNLKIILEEVNRLRFAIYFLWKNSNYIRLTFWQSPHGDFDQMGEAINFVNNFKVDKVILNCGSYNDLKKRFN